VASKKRIVWIGLVAVLGVAAFVGYAVFFFTHPFTTRGELKQFVASALSADDVLASKVCGTPVSGLLWPTPKLEELRYGQWPWAKVELESWSLGFPNDGTASARVSGVGIDARHQPITSMQSARVDFSYHCAWEDNGRSKRFICTMTSTPVVTRK
jgi:hypothetical protein